VVDDYRMGARSPFTYNGIASIFSYFPKIRQRSARSQVDRGGDGGASEAALLIGGEAISAYDYNFIDRIALINMYRNVRRAILTYGRVAISLFALKIALLVEYSGLIYRPGSYDLLTCSNRSKSKTAFCGISKCERRFRTVDLEPHYS
jgi:hypothetical protein